MSGNVNFNPSFTGNYYYSSKDVENLVKYATGVAITNKESVSATDLVASTVPDLAIKGLSWLRKNKGNYSEAMQAAKAQTQALHGVYKNGGSIVNGIKAVSNSSAANQILGMLPEAKNLSTLSKETQTLYSQAKAAALHAKQFGAAKSLENASSLLSKANAAAYAETASSATGIFAKVKNALGITKLGNAINNLAVKSPKFAKVLNVCKSNGAGIMLAMEGITETVSNVIPTFKQLGAKAGAKQIGKSAVKTAASVGGWITGAALGTKVGALIGSVIPGAGTAVGAVAGAIIGSAASLIGGALGSRFGKSVAEKVVGKDELALAKEQETKALAQKIQNDPNALNSIVNVAFEKLNNEGVSGEDAKIAYDSLQKIASASSGSQSDNSAQSSQSTTNPFASANPSFTGTPSLDITKYQSPAQKMQDEILMQQISAQYGL